MAQQSVRRGWDNQGFPQCFEHAWVIWTRSANSHTGRRLSSCRIKGRTDDSIRPRAATAPTFTLAWKGAFSNRSSAVKTSLLSPTWVTVLSAVSTSCRNIWSGPKRRHCKVHNGLTFDHMPTAPTAQLPAPSPRGDTLSASCGRVLMRYAAMTCGIQRNGSPDRHTLCRITDNLRAKATRALPGPERCSMAAAQSFRCSGRLTR
jgi:hypothetical protein